MSRQANRAEVGFSLVKLFVAVVLTGAVLGILSSVFLTGYRNPERANTTFAMGAGGAGVMREILHGFSYRAPGGPARRVEGLLLAESLAFDESSDHVHTLSYVWAAEGEVYTVGYEWNRQSQTITRHINGHPGQPLAEHPVTDFTVCRLDQGDADSLVEVRLEQRDPGSAGHSTKRNFYLRKSRNRVDVPLCP